VILDITVTGFSDWWTKHQVFTAVVAGVPAGFVSGVWVDRRARQRTALQSRFIRRQAVLALCDAAERARAVFKTLKFEARIPSRSQDAAQKAASATADFRAELNQWRSILFLVDTDDLSFLDRCEEFGNELNTTASIIKFSREDTESREHLTDSETWSSIDRKADYFHNVAERIRQEDAQAAVEQILQSVGEPARSDLSHKEPSANSESVPGVDLAR
jgi:hypothetical protein